MRTALLTQLADAIAQNDYAVIAFQAPLIDKSLFFDETLPGDSSLYKKTLNKEIFLIFFCATLFKKTAYSPDLFHQLRADLTEKNFFQYFPFLLSTDELASMGECLRLLGEKQTIFLEMFLRHHVLWFQYQTISQLNAEAIQQDEALQLTTKANTLNFLKTLKGKALQSYQEYFGLLNHPDALAELEKDIEATLKKTVVTFPFEQWQNFEEIKKNIITIFEEEENVFPAFRKTLLHLREQLLVTAQCVEAPALLQRAAVLPKDLFLDCLNETLAEHFHAERNILKDKFFASLDKKIITAFVTRFEKTVSLSEEGQQMVDTIFACFTQFNAFQTGNLIEEENPLLSLFHAAGLSAVSTEANGNTLLHWMIQKPVAAGDDALFSLFLAMGCEIQKPKNYANFTPFDLLIQNPQAPSLHQAWLKTVEEKLCITFENLEKNKPKKNSSTIKAADFFDVVSAVDILKLTSYMSQSSLYLTAKQQRVTLLQHALKGITFFASFPEKYLASIKIIQLLLEKTKIISAKTTDFLLTRLIDFYRAERAFFAAIAAEKPNFMTLLSPREQALDALYQVTLAHQDLSIQQWGDTFFEMKRHIPRDEQGETPLHIFLQKIEQANAEQLFFPLSLAKQWLHRFPDSLYLENEWQITPLHLVLSSRHQLAPIIYSLMCYEANRKAMLSGDVITTKNYLETSEPRFLNDLTHKSRSLLHEAVIFYLDALLIPLLKKGLNPLLSQRLRDTKENLNVFQLAVSKSEAAIHALQQFRHEKIYHALNTQDKSSLADWIFVKAQHVIFQTLNLTGFFCQAQQIGTLSNTLSHQQYIQHLHLPAALVFDAATVKAIFHLLKKDALLKTLDLRATHLNSDFFRQLLPVITAHKNLMYLHLDHNDLDVGTVRDIKIHLFLQGNGQIPWTTQSQLEKEDYRHPWLTTPPTLTHFVEQVRSLFSRHPAFETAEPRSALFKQLALLKTGTEKKCLSDFISQMQKPRTLTTAQWPIYRLAVDTVLEWKEFPEETIKNVKRQFVLSFVKIIGQISAVENAEWDKSVRPFLNHFKKSTSRNLFCEWILQDLDAFKKATVLFQPVHLSSLNPLIQTLAQSNPKRWIADNRSFYHNAALFTAQNELLATALADYFLSQLLFLSLENSPAPGAPISRLALLLAWRSVYALPYRAEPDWIEKTLLFIRYVHWKQTTPLETTAGVTLSARKLCQSAGFLVPLLETDFPQKGFCELSMNDWHTEVAHYGAVPLLSQEKLFFEALLKKDSTFFPYKEGFEIPQLDKMRAAFSAPLWPLCVFDAKKYTLPAQTTPSPISPGKEEEDSDMPMIHIEKGNDTSENSAVMLRLQTALMNSNKERDAQIAKNSRLTETLDQKNATIAEYERTVSTQKQTIGTQQKELDEKTDAIANHTQENKRLKQQNEETKTKLEKTEILYYEKDCLTKEQKLKIKHKREEIKHLKDRLRTKNTKKAQENNNNNGENREKIELNLNNRFFNQVNSNSEEERSSSDETETTESEDSFRESKNSKPGKKPG